MVNRVRCMTDADSAHVPSAPSVAPSVPCDTDNTADRASGVAQQSLYPPLIMVIDDCGLIACGHERARAFLRGADAPDDGGWRQRIALVVQRQGWMVQSWTPWILRRTAALEADFIPTLRMATAADVEALHAWLLAGGTLDLWVGQQLGLAFLAPAG